MHFPTHNVNVTQPGEGDASIAKAHQLQRVDKDCIENFETDPFYPVDALISPRLPWADVASLFLLFSPLEKCRL